MKVVFLLTILVCCSVVYGKNGFRIDDKCLKCLDETKTIAEDILKIAIGKYKCQLELNRVIGIIHS